MTRILASGIGIEEAEIALSGGVDIVDLKDPKAPKEQAEEKPKEDQTKGFGGFLGDKDKDKSPFPPKDGMKKDDKVAEKKPDAPKKKKDEPLDE